jgi:AcrR family transcriptional regulator
MALSQPAAGSRVERKKELTRRKIVNAALKLFKQHGFDAATMEQIAEDADIARGTLYNYFPVKEAILSEFMRQAFSQRNPERIQRLRDLPGTRERMILVLTELIAGIQAEKEIFERYLVYQVQNMVSLRRDARIQSGFDQLPVEIIRLGQESGELRRDMPFDLLVALFEFAFVEVAQQLYTYPESFNAPDIIARCVDLFMNGAARGETK